MNDTITTCTGRILPLVRRQGKCRDHLSLTPRAVKCGAPAIELACDPGVPGRPDESRCYCAEHGGPEQARAELEADWMLQAPPEVGNAAAVIDAGNATLGSEHVYVVVREHCGRWQTLLGLGGHTTQVRRADPNPEAVRKREVARRAGRRCGGGSSWATADEAEAAGVAAWRAGVEARVAEITRLRGGTLAWGMPVTPRAEPIILRPAPGQSAWDAAACVSPTEAARRGRRSRRKGKVGEREVAELLRAAGFGAARRGQQRSGLDQADVVGGPPGWRIEVKRTETVQLWAAWAQAVADAERQGERAILAVRRNASPWLAVVRLEDLLALLRESWLRAQGLS